MKLLYGSCGLICTECPAYIAHKNNDQELREKTAQQWSKIYGAEISAEDINCAGCRTKGVKFNHCENCPVRVCARQKGFATCAECPQYGCSTLEGYWKMAPVMKENLDKLR